MFIVIAAWEPTVGACVVVQTKPTLLNVTFFYTMFFDLIILSFSAVALLGKHSARTDLWKLLFKDGLVYFMVSFSMNCIPAVLNVLNLNTIMNVVATIPAASITAIASCRAVIRLQEFNASGDVYVHSVSLATNSNTVRQTMAVQKLSKKAKKFSMTRPEVHVTTEQITMAEFSTSTEATSPYSQKSPLNETSFDLESGKGIESQSVRDYKSSLEFARPA
jgi:hypothetical protein